MASDATGQSWTAAELVSDVRRVASLPTTGLDLGQADILREATDVLWSFAGWAMQQAGDGSLTDLFSRPVTGLVSSDYRAGSECDLPPLAVADTVEAVTFRSADGRTEAPLARIDHAKQSAYDTPESEGTPRAYALIGSRIRLYPRPSQGGILRFTYQRRHPTLLGDAAGTFGRLSSSSLAPSGGGAQTQIFWASGVELTVIGSGFLVDILSPNVPYRPVLTNAAVTSYVPGSYATLNVPYAMFQNVVADGLRVAPAGTSPYVHFPLEFRACVTEKVSANVMRRYGDLQNAQAAEQAALQELGRVMQMLSPRSKRDRPRAVNPHSHMRAMGRRGWNPR